MIKINIGQLNIQTSIYLAGLGQITLTIGSIAIPKILNWKFELEKVQPLIKHIFWMYAAYILTINLSFGLLSFFAFRELTDGSVLAKSISGFITVYWISRLSIQFLGFDRKNFPPRKWNKLGEIVLVSLFVFLTAVYGCAFYLNFQ